MNKFSIAVFASLATLIGASSTAFAFGNDNCYTTKPKFSEKEQQRLDAIKERQKELNCK